MVEAHGGDARVVRDPARLPRAPRTIAVLAPKSGIRSEHRSASSSARRHCARRRPNPRRSDGRSRGRHRALPCTRRPREKGAPLAWLHAAEHADLARLTSLTCRAFTLGGKRQTASAAGARANPERRALVAAPVALCGSSGRAGPASRPKSGASRRPLAVRPRRRPCLR